MNARDTHLPYFPGRARLAKLICAATLGLIFAGGVVTSKNAGLSVPDWPTSFGYQMWTMPFSMWKGGVFYEHFHRVFASLAGTLVMVMAVWLMARERRTWIRRLALACFVVVVLQGLLGGVTVLLSLPVAVSVSHGVLAQLFLCLSVILAYALSRERAARANANEPPPARAVTRILSLFLALLVAQLVLAAFMRHDMKPLGGVAIPDFPKTAGGWMPSIDADSVAWVNAWRAEAVTNHGAGFTLDPPLRAYQLVVHLGHRLLAGVLAAVWVWLAVVARRRCAASRRVLYTVYGVGMVLAFQLMLGMFAVWSNRSELITSLHVACGAALLAGSVLLALRVARVPAASPA